MFLSFEPPVYPTALASLQKAADYVHLHNRHISPTTQIELYTSESRRYDVCFKNTFWPQTEAAHQMWVAACREHAGLPPEEVADILKDSVEWQRHMQEMLDTAREIQTFLQSVEASRSRIHRQVLYSFIQAAERELGQDGRWAAVGT